MHQHHHRTLDYSESAGAAGGSRSGSTSTLDRTGLLTTPIRGSNGGGGVGSGHRGCKTEQLLERQKAVQAVAVLSKESAFNLRCLWVGWVFMCWVSGMMTAAGFLLPYWLKGSRQASDARKQLSDLGLFRLCAYPRQMDGQVKLVMDCGHYRHFAEIPSPLWKLAFVLMATACCLLLLLTFFLAFTGFRLFILRIKAVVAICGAAQAFSSLFVLLSCVLYPAGWRENPDVAQVCGPEADAFSLGHCHLGWAYVLTCAGGFLCAVTVAFPAQIAKHFPEESLTASTTAAVTAGVSATAVRSPCHYQASSQQQLLPAASPQAGCGTNGGRYNYVVYHSLQPMHQHQLLQQPTPQHQLHHQHQHQHPQTLSRPPSVCTCAIADCQAASGSMEVPGGTTAAAAAAAAASENGDVVDGSGNGGAGVGGRYSDLTEEDGNAGAVI